ncbi:MAG: OadG family transporter subunit [Saprospiraceae bacterium]
MSAELQTALLLLVVGMITVFIILSLVVLTGRTLIWVVNKYFSPEEKITYEYKVPFVEDDVIYKKKLAAIAAAVEIATRGKGKIIKIEKM